MNFLFKQAYSIDKDISACKIRGLVRSSCEVNKALGVVIRALGKAIAADSDNETPVSEKPYFRRSMFAINTLCSVVPIDSRYRSETPLYIATEIGCAPTIRVLIAAGFVEDGNALHLAFELGFLEIAEILMNTCAINLCGYVSYAGITLLHAAAHGLDDCPESVRIVERLIAAGCNVNQKGYRDRTALFGRACENPEMIAVLVAAGADVNQCCGKTESGAELFPLHCAAAGRGERGAECIHLLLRLGAKIDVRNSTRYSALSSAALFNNHSTLKALLAAGARVDPKQDYDSAVTHIENCLVFLLAVEYDHDVCTALFRRISCEYWHFFDDLKTLVAAGADFAAVVTDEVRKAWRPLEDDDMIDKEAKEGVLRFLAELGAADDLSQLDWFDGKRAEFLMARAEISAMIFDRYRDDTATICIGLQSLGLPALVTLAVIDAWLDWHPHYHLVPMHKKWDLIAGVKHFEMPENDKNKRKRN